MDSSNLNQLKDQAIEEAQHAGHFLGDFEALSHNAAISNCLLCGKQAYIEMDRFSGESTGGDALTTNCDD